MSYRQKKKIFLMFLVLPVIFCFGITEVFSEVNGLFSKIPYSTDLYVKQKQEKPDPTVIRSRYVQVNFKGLVGKDIPQGAESISLNLFDDVNLTAVKDRLERRSETQYTWFGRISDIELSQVIMVVEDGVMASNITLNGKIYQVLFVGNGIHSIREIDQSKFPEEAPPIPVKTPYTPDSTLPSEMPDTGSYIDVMVAYTADARNAAGGTTAMNTQIQLAIDETNQSYSNSGITQRLNLVNRGEVTYTETGDMYTDLDRLTSTSDGYMDNVHTLRNTYGADLVSLWVNNGGSYCGIAWLMTSVSTAFATNGFNVVDLDCATGYYTFGHELGHNMGAHHDRYVTSGQGAYPYSYGYVSPYSNWRTIMAYGNACGGCTRVQYWSNPDVTYGGVAMGVPEGSSNAADNRKTLNNTAYTVANFRTSSSSISHTLTPPSNTSVSQGGILGPFYGTITNNGSSSQTVYIYPYLYTPAGSWVNIFGKSATISAGETHSSGAGYMAISSNAQTGTYYHYVIIYDTSWNQLDADYHTFTVTSASQSPQSSDDSLMLKQLMETPGAEIFENEGWKMIILPEN